MVRCHLTTYITRYGSGYLIQLGQVCSDLYDVMNGKLQEVDFC